MFRAPYEGVVGWRYLLRPRPRPRVLYIGLALLILGAAVATGSYAYQASQGMNPGIFSTETTVWRQLMLGGGALGVLGACIALFGALNAILTLFSAFSTFMVAMGVAVVILVLGVMNGFQADLRDKIISTYAHVVVEPIRGERYLPDYHAMVKTVRGVDGVLGATPYLDTEVMLTSPTNLSAVVLKGVDVGSIGDASSLQKHLKRGTLESLTDPDLVDPFELDAATLKEVDSAEQLIDMKLDAEARQRAKGRAEDYPPKAAPPAPDPDLEAFGMDIPAPTAAEPAPSPAVLVGVELRRNLNIWPGDPINVVSPLGELGPHGPVPKSRPFQLAGWFESGMLEFDSKLAYADIAAVQRFVGVEDVASGIQVKVADLDRARDVRDRLAAALGETARVTDWQARNASLFGALQLEKIAMFIVLSIILVLAAFAITATLVMTILERRREIAILLTMGADKRGILRIFIAQGAFAGMLGCLLGDLVGVSGALGIASLELPMDQQVYYIPTIPVDARVIDVVAINAMALLISVVSTIYPAFYASGLKPVEGLSAE